MALRKRIGVDVKEMRLHWGHFRSGLLFFRPAFHPVQVRPDRGGSASRVLQSFSLKMDGIIAMRWVHTGQRVGCAALALC
jgi:hypothetical protein